jgi:hypothetical protein
MTLTLNRVKPDETDEVLAGMFTENTGRHMLDSGDHYGRSWQRNSAAVEATGLTAAEYLLSRPTVTLDAGRYGPDITLDTFHWLRDKVTYDERLTRMFDLWVAIRDTDDPWLVEAENFGALLHERSGESWRDGVQVVNTYNGDSSLSQVLQYVTVDTHEWGTVVILQVHGGCDVRGGYTRPKVFTLDEEYALYDEQYTLHCTREHSDDEPLPGMPEPSDHYLDCRNGEWTDSGGSFIGNPWSDKGEPCVEVDDEWIVQCPYCADPTPMTVSTWY